MIFWNSRILKFLFVSTLFSIYAHSSTYYWVGNSGNWSNYSSHWATTSGGQVFYNQSPSQNDDVVFDANSFTLSGQSVNIDGATAICKSFSIQPSISNNPTFVNDPGNVDLHIFGSLTLQTGIIWSYGFPSVISMMAPSGSQTVKCGGNSFQELDFNTNATWSQMDSLRANVIRLNNGTYRTNNFPLSNTELYFGTTQTNTFWAGTSPIHCDNWYGWTYGHTNMHTDSCTIYMLTYFQNSSGRHFKKLIMPVYSSQCTFQTDTCTIDTLETFGTWFQLLGQQDSIRYIYSTQNFIFYLPNHCQYAEMLQFTRFDQNGSCDFDTLFLNNPGYTVSLYPNDVETINYELLTPNSACADLITINSQVPGQQASFYKASGTITCSGLALQDCAATGGATFTANNSIDHGNVTGWVINAVSVQTYYWVGDSGDWFDGLHWSTTSGGVAGTCIPTSNDSIVFDQNSFSGAGNTVVIDHASINIRSLNAMNVIYPFTISSSQTNIAQQIFCSANFQLSNLVTWGYHDTYLEMIAPSGINTLQIGGNSLSQIDFLSDGTWNFLDTAYVDNLSVNRGNLNLKMNYMRTGSFYSPFTDTRSINLGTTKLVTDNFGFGLSGLTADADSCKLYVGNNFSNQTNCVFDSVFTFNGNSNATGVDLVTGTIRHLIVNNSTAIEYSGLFEHVLVNQRLSLNANGGHIENLDARNDVIVGANFTIDTLQMNNPNYAISIGVNLTLTLNDLIANGTCNGLLTMQSWGASTSNQGFIFSNSTSINADEIMISNISALGTAGFNATNALTNGTVNGWNISANTSQYTYYWVGGTGSWYDSNHWSFTSGGTPASCIPSPNDDVVFDSNSFVGNDTVNMLDQHAYCHNITCTGFTVQPVFTGTVVFNPNALGSLNVSGSMHLLPNILWAYDGHVIFYGSERNRQVAAAGKPFSGVQFNGPGGSWIFTDSLRYLDQFVQYSGSINTNGQTINGGTDFTIRDTMLLGTSSIILDQAYFDAPVSPTWTGIVDADSAYISCNNINGYRLRIHHLNFDGYPASQSSTNIPLTNIDLMTSSNVLSDFNASDSIWIQRAVFNGPVLIESPVRIKYCDFRNNFTVQRQTIFDTLIVNNPSYSTYFPADSNLTVNNKLFTNGSASYQINIMSTTPGTQTNIVVPMDTVCMEYVNFRDINATGGAVFYAGFYSVDLGNNSGLNFTACQIPMSNVWPGDANNDLTVDNSDVLYVGLAFNEIGFVRPGASTSWVAQPCVDWNRIFSNLVNISHADCDGNGTIDSTDLNAVYLNYGQTHPPIANPNNPLTGNPRSGADLFLDPTVNIYSPGDLVTIPVKLGTPAVPANSIYGTAYTITYDNSKIVSGSVSMTYPSSWFTPNGNRVSFQLDNFPSAKIDDSQTRTNLTNVSGDGSIAYLHFQIASTATGTIVLDITGVTAVDNLGNPITLMPIGTTLNIIPLSVRQNSIAADVQIFPNPTNGNSTLTYSIQQKENVRFEIYDVTGKLIYTENKPEQNAGEYSVVVPMEKLSDGIYFCRFTAGQITNTMRIVKTE